MPHRGMDSRHPRRKGHGSRRPFEGGHCLLERDYGRARVAGVRVAWLLIAENAVELVGRVVPVAGGGHQRRRRWVRSVDREGRCAGVYGESVKAHQS